MNKHLAVSILTIFLNFTSASAQTALPAKAVPATQAPAPSPQPVVPQPTAVAPSPPPTVAGKIPGAPSAAVAPGTPTSVTIPGAPAAAGITGAPQVNGGLDPTTGAAPNAAGIGLTATDELSDILEEFKYDPTNRRDPFMPFVANRGAAVGSIGPVMPLQKYELEKLKLVGVMWDVKDPRALIKAPGGDVFTIRKDSRIGNRNGYVAQIRSGEIIVVETIESSGRLLYQTRIIRVAKDNEKGPS